MEHRPSSAAHLHFSPQEERSQTPGTPRSPLVIGHRGAASFAPENTLSSVRHALNDGARAVEVDVHATRDGAVVVHHDATLDRTATAGRTTGAIADLTLAEVRECLLADGEPVPTLDETLALMGSAPLADGSAPQLLIEIKADAAAEPVARRVRDTDAAVRVRIISFSVTALERVRQLAPELPCTLLADVPSPEVTEAANALGIDQVAFSVAGIDPKAFATEHAAGRTVGIWTVHTYDQVRRALACGVSTLTADDPAWCQACVDKLLT
ncbi:glycerophosphodiester phosphodiesterase [Devriesea agamarum]|uniref:glycerophosphodiester phosphodiesterase n=1 Tax=Devriesea agamarum TaxID=472569 RepID=UPI00071E4E96|nr:glycerophosphodiester phosphodiesterase [Devriesea agamarum]